MRHIRSGRAGPHRPGPDGRRLRSPYGRRTRPGCAAATPAPLEETVRLRAAHKQAEDRAAGLEQALRRAAAPLVPGGTLGSEMLGRLLAARLEAGPVLLQAVLCLSPLFDAAFYRDQLPGEPPADAVAHYLEHGRLAGLSPHPLFDAAFYVDRHPEAGPDPFLHFLLVGCAADWSPHPLFDPAYYRAHAGGRLDPDLPAVLHYLLFGGSAGDPPCRLFDGVYYLETYADVAASGLNPLVHYVRYGWKEGRRPHPLVVPAAAGDTEPWRRPPPPTAVGAPPAIFAPPGRRRFGLTGLSSRVLCRNEPHQTRFPGDFTTLAGFWRETPPPRPEPDDPVNICVSVYQGHDYLNPFFSSLLAHTEARHRLVLVDNGNTDPAVRDILREVALVRPGVLLVRRERNRGYVDGICAAFEAVADRGLPGHLVLVNTDVQLPPDWLPRLLAPILEDPNVASVTPFTNAGTVCSFPWLGRDNTPLFGLSCAAIDEAFRHVRLESRLELPSCVGFCMAMNRAAIEEIGFFDNQTFALGYGEENDWSLRAAAWGYRNVLCEDLFVYHKHGGTYPGRVKRALMARHMAVVEGRYPGYQAMVADFCRLDAIRPVRALLALRLAALAGGRGLTLVFDHAYGGGANLFRETLVEELLAGPTPVVLAQARPGTDLFDAEIVSQGGSFAFSGLPVEALLSIAAVVPIAEVFVNSIVSHSRPAALLDTLLAAGRRHGFALTYALHDYYPLCPSYHLLGTDGLFCGLPSGPDCVRCYDRLPGTLPDFAADDLDLAAWRALWVRFLGAATVVCFSDSSVALLRQIFPDLPPDAVVVRPHRLEHFQAAGRPVRLRPGDGPHIGIVGNIHPPKGSAFVHALADVAAAAGVPITVFGTLDPPARTDETGLTVLGPYDHATLPARIAASGANVFLLPSVCPETFSYVAEELMAMELPVACFDLGAPAERVGRYARGQLLPSFDPWEVLMALRQLYAASLAPHQAT